MPDFVLARRVDDELVLLNLESEQYYGLDVVGTAIWESLTTAATVQDALGQLMEQFEVDRATLTRDVDHLVEELSARGLVEVDSP